MHFTIFNIITFSYFTIFNLFVLLTLLFYIYIKLLLELFFHSAILLDKDALINSWIVFLHNSHNQLSSNSIIIMNFDQIIAFVWPRIHMDAILVKVIPASLIFCRQ